MVFTADWDMGHHFSHLCDIWHLMRHSTVLHQGNLYYIIFDKGFSIIQGGLRTISNLLGY